MRADSDELAALLQKMFSQIQENTKDSRKRISNTLRTLYRVENALRDNEAILKRIEDLEEFFLGVLSEVFEARQSSKEEKEQTLPSMEPLADRTAGMLVEKAREIVAKHPRVSANSKGFLIGLIKTFEDRKSLTDQQTKALERTVISYTQR